MYVSEKGNSKVDFTPLQEEEGMSRSRRRTKVGERDEEEQEE